MNQLTTIAALPSGGGCMSSLPAEVYEYDYAAHKAMREQVLESALAKLGYCVKDGVIERLPVEKAEKSWGAFEPFEYTERS